MREVLFMAITSPVLADLLLTRYWSAIGKATRGYDPSQDIVWLRSEIVQWIQGNLMAKWGSIKRRHIAVKATAVETLQGQFSGYGSTAAVVSRTLDRLNLNEPLENWSDETISKVV